MPTVKFSLSDEYYQKLENMAREEGISIQDCIRNRIFQIKTIFTPAEAVRRALQKYLPGEPFTLPELYGDEWTLKRGEAGVFGKQFFQYIQDQCSNQIIFSEMVNSGRHAQYKIL